MLLHDNLTIAPATVDSALRRGIESVEVLGFSCYDAGVTVGSRLVTAAPEVGGGIVLTAWQGNSWADIVCGDDDSLVDALAVLLDRCGERPEAAEGALHALVEACRRLTTRAA